MILFNLMEKKRNRYKIMQKIYWIENEKIFKNWASKTYEYKINQLKTDNIVQVLDIFQIEEKNEHILSSDYLIFGWNVTTISKYYTYKYDFYKKYVPQLENNKEIEEKINPIIGHHKKIQVVQDLHQEDYHGGIESLIKYLIENRFYGILTPYSSTSAIKKIREQIPSLVIYYLPHHIDSNYFKNYQLPKVYDIFFFGNSKPKFYPFRNRLKKLLQTNEELKAYNILIWDGIRNYFKFDATKSNDELSKVINQSWLTICTKSTCNMLLGKYFETSMSGSVICGDICEDGIPIWGENMVYIDNGMDDEQIIKVISNELLNKEALNKKAENMEEIMQKYHLENFTNNLISILD